MKKILVISLLVLGTQAFAQNAPEVAKPPQDTQANRLFESTAPWQEKRDMMATKLKERLKCVEAAISDETLKACIMPRYNAANKATAPQN